MSAQHLKLFLNRCFLFFGILLIAFNSYAEISDDDVYLELMTLLSKQTEMVTKTKVNADYVPGSFSVLRSSELQRYGVRTVKDALAMTPSIEVQTNHLGHTILVMRGLGTPFSGGMVKLMWNGRNMVSTSAGMSEAILNMPVEQIARIEIIRGAASVLHGDFAYAGVINIVTETKNQFSVAAGRFGYQALNASQQLSSKSGWSLGLGFSQWQRDKSDTQSGSDVLTNADAYLPPVALSDYSQAPGLVNDRKAYRHFDFSLAKDSLNIYLQAQEFKAGDYYGLIEFLPKDTRDYNQAFEDLTFGVQQEKRLNEQWQYNWNLSWQQHSYQLNTLYTSADIAGTDDQKELAHYHPYQNLNTEQVVNLSSHVIYQPNSKHRILVGGEFERYEIVQSKSRSMCEGCDADFTSGLERSYRLGSKGDGRDVFAIYLQDEWRPFESLTLTFGLRAEQSKIDYVDISNDDLSEPFKKLEEPYFTPKISAVYALNSQHILKAQYSRSTITPPIHQVVNVGDERPYKTQTDHYELGYIFQANQHVQRLTAFYSDFDGLPKGTVYYHYFAGGMADYKKLEDVVSYGAEWESEFSLNAQWGGFANATWLTTEDVNNKKPMAGTANVLANLGLNFKPNSDWSLATQVQHVGERHREPYDSRKKLTAYSLWHAHLSYGGFIKGLTISLAAKNLTDEKIKSPSPVNGTLTEPELAGEPTAAVTGDYVGAGREVWAQLRYSY